MVFVEQYLHRLSELFTQIDHSEIELLLETLNSCSLGQRTVFIVGNGGSAATASHMVNDLSIGLQKQGHRFRAFCLSDNTPSLTAVANDSDYSEIFSSQLRVLAREGDLLILFSASGNSPNLISACDEADRLGIETFGILGFDGGTLRARCDKSVLVPTARGEYGPVEDVHMMIDHIVLSYFSQK